MPEFEVTAPDGRTFVVTAPEGASQDEILKFAQANMPKPTAGQSFVRGLGLGVRDAIEGVGQLPGMAYDAVGIPLNLGIKGINAITGANIPEIKTARENLAAIGDAAGLPKPVTPGERIRSDVGRNVAGLIPSMGTGAVLAGGGPVASKVGQALMAAPGAQVMGAAGTGLGEGAARENGYGPAAQFGAALAGGITGAAVPTVAGMIGQGVAGMTQPFREGGRQKIVAEALLRNSSDPETLAQRLREGADDATRRLPGSPVTAGVAARDPQMMILESGLRSDAQTAPGVMSPATALRDVEAVRNANRNAVAEALIKGEADVPTRGATIREGLQAGESAMKARTRQMYDAVNQAERFPLQPIADKFAEVEGKFFGTLSGGLPQSLRDMRDEVTGLLKAGGDVDWSALQNLRRRLGGVVDAAKRDPERGAEGAAASAMRELIDNIGMSPEWQAATAQRRAVGQALLRNDAGVNATGRVMREAGFGTPMLPDEKVAGVVTASPGAVKQTLAALDKAIADGTAANLPVEQMAALRSQAQTARQAMQDQVIDDLLRASRTTSDIADASGNVTRQLSPAQFRRWWDKNADTVGLLFTGKERATLERLAADFAEGTVANTARARGSDTAQNLSVGNFIARLTGGVVDPQNPLAQAMGNMGPVANWIVKQPEQAMRQMLVEAIRDPKLAAMLVEKAGPGSLQRALTYVEGTMGQRIKDAGMDALTRQVPRALLAAPSNPQETGPRVKGR